MLRLKWKQTAADWGISDPSASETDANAHIQFYSYLFPQRNESWNQPENIWYQALFFSLFSCCSVVHEPFFMCAAREKESETWVSRPLRREGRRCFRSDIKCRADENGSSVLQRWAFFFVCLFLAETLCFALMSKEEEERLLWKEMDCSVRHIQYTWWFVVVLSQVSIKNALPCSKSLTSVHTCRFVRFKLNWILKSAACYWLSENSPNTECAAIDL